MRVPGRSSFRSLAQLALTLGDRNSVTTVAAECRLERVPLDEGDPLADLGLARDLARHSINFGSSSTPTPRAPYFCAAMMTMRPSPDRGRRLRRPW